jgi:hypothetical protein
MKLGAHVELIAAVFPEVFVVVGIPRSVNMARTSCWDAQIQSVKLIVTFPLVSVPLHSPLNPGQAVWMVLQEIPTKSIGCCHSFPLTITVVACALAPARANTLPTVVANNRRIFVFIATSPMRVWINCVACGARLWLRASVPSGAGAVKSSFLDQNNFARIRRAVSELAAISLL